jgi:small subunit ribosomal protein S1
VHLSDLDWKRPGDEAIADYKKGDMVKVKVLDVDTDKERISLGIKQLGDDPFEGQAGELKKGDVVTCTVTGVSDKGLDVEVNGAPAFIRKADLARDRSEQQPERFAVGEKLDATVTTVDRISRKLTLSVKAHEMQEEKKAMAQYGSSDSGASLGDILGAALNKARDKSGADEDKKG